MKELQENWLIHERALAQDLSEANENYGWIANEILRLRSMAVFHQKVEKKLHLSEAGSVAYPAQRLEGRLG